MIAIICIVGSWLALCVYGQTDCTCPSAVTGWQCTDNEGNVYYGGNAGYEECVQDRSDLWNGVLDCKYCYKCLDSGIADCECDVQENCDDVFTVVGVIFIVLGVIFMLWQGFILYRFFNADGEVKDVWKLMGCFVVGLACLIIGILMVADQALWYSTFT